MTEPAAQTAMVPAPRVTGGLVVASMAEAIQLANMMAKSALVPVHLQGKAHDCLMVIHQASMWGMAPLSVAQCTSVIRGRLMFEGKLVAAVVNTRGELAERLDYFFDGQGDDLVCKVVGKLKGESRTRAVVVSLRDQKTTNDCWRKQPEQQLCYAGARVWARRHLPEVMLGVYTPEDRVDDLPPPPTPEQKAWAEYTGPKVASAATPASGVTSPSPGGGERASGSAAPGAAGTSPSPDPKGQELACDDCGEVFPLGSWHACPVPTGRARAASSAATPAESTESQDARPSREPGSDDDDDDDEEEPIEPWSARDPRVAAEYPGAGEFRDEVECWWWRGAKGNKKWGQGDGEWVSRGMEPQRSLAQNALFHVLRQERGYDDPTWRSKLSTRFNKSSSAELSVREGGILIEAMQRSTAQHGTADDKRERQRRRAAEVAEEMGQELGARGIGPDDVL